LAKVGPACDVLIGHGSNDGCTRRLWSGRSIQEDTMNALTASMLAGALVMATRADAGPVAAPAHDTPSLALAMTEVVSPAPSLATSVTAGSGESFQTGDRTNESIRYRPRWRRARPYSDEEPIRSNRTSGGYAQIHGGFFDPTGSVANGAVFGTRIGTNIDDRVQVGVGADWTHRSDRQTAVVGTSPLPGGGTAERRVDLASASSDLVPVLGFIQVAPSGIRSGPYVGVAAGWEALFVSGRDFATNADFDATYQGWGWQLYGGFALPLSNASRLTVEGFTNQGDLDRDIVDAGVTYREVVDASGGGMRFGVSWTF
jgi:hypothetical protein